ncbi:hypothetical protein SKAU_G00342120 [Synaphobranchus kaupii]|uniref:DDE Tnp4 domain-containing protein n=1 Tax=Synaphobranchus kaupii TaxID=118154 RepID=A0A9Q1EN75_SYNKA|nr:hypothetical protein SKAU_G00342120 [Synaphobranchus kaupii]
MRAGTLFGSLSSGISSKSKYVAWQSVAQEKWSDLKLKAKKRIGHHRASVQATGGGSATPNLTAEDDRIAAIIGESAVGVYAEGDTDLLTAADSEGDRGYPLKMWLLTPFANPRTAEELRYNLAHGRTRSVVEHTIGLKGRWRCLDASGGKLLYKPEKVTRIILACGVLHNITLRHGIAMDVELEWTPKSLLTHHPMKHLPRLMQ